MIRDYLRLLEKINDLTKRQQLRDLFRFLGGNYTNLFYGKSAIDLERLLNVSRSCYNQVSEAHNVTGLLDNVSFQNFTDAVKSHDKTVSTIRKEIITCFGYASDSDLEFSCNDDIEASVRGIMFAFSFIILLFMSFFVTKREKACLSCCCGHPGSIVPVNLIDSYRNRHGYMLGFGVTVTACMSVLFGSYGSVIGVQAAQAVKSSPSYLSVFIRISLAIFISLISYPIFIAQNLRSCTIGCILGLVYSSTWLLLSVTKLIYSSKTCWLDYRRINKAQLATFEVMQDIPKLICLFALTVRFVYVLINIVLERKAKKFNKCLEHSWKTSFGKTYSNWREDYMFIHVDNVFNKRVVKITDQDEELMTEKTFKDKIMSFIRLKIYTVKPGFLYSTRFMISSFVSVLAVYTVIIYICSIGYVVFNKSWREDWFTVDKMRSLSEQFGMDIRVVKKHVVWIAGCWWFALVVTCVFHAIVFLNSMMWYRRHVLMLRAGDRSFLPSSIKKGSLDCGTLINASITYAGYHIGYSTWGFVTTFVVIWLIFVFITVFLLIPIIYGTPSFVINIIKGYWITMVVAILTVIVQGQLVMRCFLISMDSTAIDNRRAFHVTSYVMFYFNIFRGVVACLLRIGLGAILGVVFLQRLQKSTLPRSFERRDPGYLAYLGFLFIEHQHSNPVLQCFVRILLETQNKSMTQNDVLTYKRGASRYVVPLTMKILEDVEMDTTDSNKVYKRMRKYRARNRWFLLLMLFQNPSLRKYRSHRLLRTSSTMHLSHLLSQKIKQFQMHSEEEVSVETVENLLAESKRQLEEEQQEDESRLIKTFKSCQKMKLRKNRNRREEESAGSNQPDDEQRSSKSNEDEGENSYAQDCDIKGYYRDENSPITDERELDSNVDLEKELPTSVKRLTSDSDVRFSKQTSNNENE